MKRKFVFGDIHGCFDEFIELKEKLDIQKNDEIIIPGDFVDRGPKSKELYHYLKENPEIIVLMGNHERKHLHNILSYAQEIVKVQLADDYKEFLTWLKTLPYYYETDEAIIVHAAIDPQFPLEKQKEEVLAGSTAGTRYLTNKYTNDNNWYDYYDGNKSIIYGHKVVGLEPEVINNTYGIDTGACHGDFLTALEIPGFIVHQVKVSRDYWKEEMDKWQVPVLKAKTWETMNFPDIYRQIEKLQYLKNKEAHDYLHQIDQWVQNLKKVVDKIYKRIELTTRELLNNNEESFNMEAQKFNYRSFLFQCRSGKFTLEKLENKLTTPEKIYNLARELQITDIPAKP